MRIANRVEGNSGPHMLAWWGGGGMLTIGRSACNREAYCCFVYGIDVCNLKLLRKSKLACATVRSQSLGLHIVLSLAEGSRNLVFSFHFSFFFLY